MNTYKCHHCNKTVERDSDKAWIKSYCEPTGKMVRLWKLPDFPVRSEHG